MRVLPAADVDVRVIDDQGQPITGAEVMHSRTSTPGHYWLDRDERYLTAADGRLRLEDLALGQTAIHAWAPGYGLGSTLCYVGADQAVVIRLPKTDVRMLRLILRGGSTEQIGAARWMLYAVRDGYGAGCNLPPSLTGGSLDADGSQRQCDRDLQGHASLAWGEHGVARGSRSVRWLPRCGTPIGSRC